MKLLVFISALLASSLSLSGTYNYAEIGMGASKWVTSTSDDEYDKSVEDYDPSAAIRLSTGSRIGRSVNSWFDLTYIYSANKDLGATDLVTQMVLAGLKFSTDPRKNTSAYVKLGAGKAFSQARSEGQLEEDSNSVQQLGFGSSFRLNPKQSVVFEALVIRADWGDGDLFDNYFTISLNQFL